MENMNLEHFSLFLDSELVVVKEEVPKLISKLFNDSSEPEFEVNTPQKPEDDLIFEGNFGKAIMVIYQGSHLEPELREFLFKILGAVGCSLKDIALTASESVEEVSLKSIETLNPSKILVFGKLNHELSNKKQHDYEILNDEGVEYLFADDLKDINGKVSLKKSLWSKLQVLFGIKS
ncbi:hypothetical protein SAMN06295967_106124 [Belliella buryatensis]|uniref:Uncharacterized protein n=1 Tax=Belliella buryatensis TaxID=1500549 RepID=A0A239D4X5_9BACT|nr:hypothetical protein [Belliella buryatensis]SNS27400.1 hypothetical protein SAMN06295967_106124 [Belliella buryatensis]